MRTRPGPTFWAWVYSILYFFQVGWPGWAGTAAGAIFYLFAGKLAGPADAQAVYWIGVCTFLVCVTILLFGGHIERTLEMLNWILIVLILGTLAALCLVYVSPNGWLAALAGFVGYDVRARSFNFSNRRRLVPDRRFRGLFGRRGHDQLDAVWLDTRQRFWHGRGRGLHSCRLWWSESETGALG